MQTILNISNDNLRTASFLLPLFILAFFIVMAIMSLIAKQQRSHLKLLLISLLLFVSQYFIYLQINAAKLAISYFLIPSEMFYSALPVLFIVITLGTYILLTRFGNFDELIYTIVVTISWIGLLMLLRLSLDLSKFPSLAFKSTVIVFSGLVAIPAMVILLRRRQEWLVLRRTTYTWLMLSVFLLVVTAFIGGVDHSIRINGGNFRIQPVEYVKLLYLLFMAAYFASFGEALNSLKRTSLSLKEYLRFATPLLMAWFIVSLILLVQKDLGPAIVISLFSFAMLLYIAPRPELTILITAGFFILLITAWTLGGLEYKEMLRDFPYLQYAVEKFRVRLDSCLYPFQYSETMSRSLWAVSTGYLTGTGIGLSDCYRIPVVHTDFIFSAIIQEMGAVGGIAIIFGYLTILTTSVRIAISSDDIYVKAISIGAGLLIFIEATLIIAGNLSIIPLTGITLPFVSAGGSSFIAHCIMIGMLIYLSLKNEVLRHEK